MPFTPKASLGIPGTLTAPAGYGGANAPVVGAGNPDTAPTVGKAQNSNSPSGTNMKAQASDEAVSVLNLSVALVLGATAILWVLGGIVFKSANL